MESSQVPYQPPYQPAHEPPYQPAHEPAYQPVHEPACQPAYQPAQEPACQPACQPAYEPAVLSCANLWKTYKSQPALANVNLYIPSGRVVGLLGPNGSGKTTLIKLAAGLLTPTQGEILIAGQKPGPYTKSIVSYLPERPYFSPSMKVSSCIAMFADFYADFDRTTALDMLGRLGVDVNASFSALSKGTKEKVQLVLVMARHAKLYLLDEPIGGVDPAVRDYILNTIITNYHPEATVLISTHLVEDVERVLDDYIFLRYGQIIAYAPVSTVSETGCASLNELFKREFIC